MILRNILSSEKYEHFLFLHVAIRILATPSSKDEQKSLAKQFLVYFSKQFSRIYGKENLVYNVHSLIHLADDCIVHNCHLDEISCFPFENRLGQLVRLVKASDSKNYLAQLRNRLIEMSNLPPKNSSKLSRSNEDAINLNSFRDTTFLFKPGCVVKVTQVMQNFVVGRKLTLLKERDNSFTNLYTVFIVTSSDLDIYLSDGLSDEQQWPKHEFNQAVKCVVFPTKKFNVIFPLLHHM